MNLVFLVALGKKYGGGTYSMYKFADYLSRLGHSVSVFYVSRPDFLKNHASRLIVNRGICFSWFFKGQLYSNRKIEQIHDFFSLNRYLRKNNKNIDYLIGYQRRMGIKAARLGKKYGIEIVNFVFETPLWLEKQWGAEWMRRYDNKRLKKSWQDFKMALGDSQIIFANSKLTAKSLIEWLGRYPDGFIYPGCDCDTSCSQRVSKNDSIIYIGRLYKNKNIDEIIKAFSKISTSARLIVCGDGPEAKALKKFSKDLKIKCEFKGFVNEIDKWRLISSSRFMVFASSFEGFGIPPMEALANGIPCICSDIPIFREVYNNKVEYFEEHNTEQLREKIQYLLNNPIYCEHRGNEGRRYVVNKFGWDKSARKIERILLSYKKS